jgi:hypothetical protein
MKVPGVVRTILNCFITYRVFLILQMKPKASNVKLDKLVTIIKYHF